MTEEEVELLELALAQSRQAVDNLERIAEKIFGQSISNQSSKPNPQSSTIGVASDAPRLL